MNQELEAAARSGDVEFLRRVVASEQLPDYFLTLNDSQQNIFHVTVENERVEWMRVGLEIIPISIKHKIRLLSQGDYLCYNPLHYAANVESSNDSVEMVKLILNFYKSNSSPPELVLKSSMPMEGIKVLVLKVDVHDDKGKKKAMKIASSVPGIYSISFDVELQTLTVIGNMDPVVVVSKLRKTFCTYIVSIGPGKEKPWLLLSRCTNSTPLHIALENGNEESAMEIMSMDMKLLCSMVRNDGSSPLFDAVKKGCNKVAEKILASSFSYSLSGEDGSTPLHFAPNSSEKVLRLLIEKHPELMDVEDDNMYDILHKWVELDEVWAFDLLLKGNLPTLRSKVYSDLINKPQNFGIVASLIKCYNEATMESAIERDGDTPLHLALYSRNEEVALYILSLDSTLCHTVNYDGMSPLLAAVKYGCGKVVEYILSTQNVRFKMLQASGGFTVLHGLPNVSERIGRNLLEKYWWMIDFTDNCGATALDLARAENTPWLINSLRKPIRKDYSFNWITKCERDELYFVHTFIDSCKDLQKVCRELNDTPLDHIKLESYVEYLDLLKKPSIAQIWNLTDLDGATPLHRALDRKDLLLAKALLVQDGVGRNIEDYKGRTAMSMLANLSKENIEWERMCNQVKVNPYLKTTYIHPRTNLDQMRNTLSVVATLLATITFAAAFTLPGGLNNDTGRATLAKKAAFLVFLLADAYAMCTSILVLFCLIWSMVPDRDMTYLLMDRSVFILMQALYGTMVAFMSGIYAVIQHNSLWAAIIILIMCSFIVISVNRTVLHNVLAKLLPRKYRYQSDRSQTFDEEKALIHKEGEPETTNEESSIKALQISATPSRKNDVIPEQNQNQGDSEKKNPFPSTKHDYQEVVGTSSKHLMNSTSFMRDKDEDIRMLEEGNAFESGNYDAKFERSTLSSAVQKTKSSLKEKNLISAINHECKGPILLHDEQDDYEKKMVEYTEDAFDKDPNEVHLEALSERKKRLIPNLETDNDLLIYKKSLSFAESSIHTPTLRMEQFQQQMSEQFANFERQHVEFERQRVEFERQRVEFERQRVEWERQRLELEKERLEKESERGGN